MSGDNIMKMSVDNYYLLYDFNTYFEDNEIFQDLIKSKEKQINEKIYCGTDFNIEKERTYNILICTSHALQTFIDKHKILTCDEDALFLLPEDFNDQNQNKEDYAICALLTYREFYFQAFESMDESDTISIGLNEDNDSEISLGSNIDYINDFLNEKTLSALVQKGINPYVFYDNLARFLLTMKMKEGVNEDTDIRLKEYMKKMTEMTIDNNTTVNFDFYALQNILESEDDKT